MVASVTFFLYCRSLFFHSLPLKDRNVLTRVRQRINTHRKLSTVLYHLFYCIKILYTHCFFRIFYYFTIYLFIYSQDTLWKSGNFVVLIRQFNTLPLVVHVYMCKVSILPVFQKCLRMQRAVYKFHYVIQ